MIERRWSGLNSVVSAQFLWRGNGSAAAYQIIVCQNRTDFLNVSVDVVIVSVNRTGSVS